MLTDDLKRLEEENRRLRGAVDELAILNDLALAIGGSLDSEKIMRSIIGKSYTDSRQKHDYHERALSPSPESEPSGMDADQQEATFN